MQKVGCTWDPGNFITQSQAVSVQDPGLCASCPGQRTGNMAQTALCVIATSRWGLVICPSAVTSVADHADIPASLSVFPRLLSLKLCRLDDRSAVAAPGANDFCDTIKNNNKINIYILFHISLFSPHGSTLVSEPLPPLRIRCPKTTWKKMRFGTASTWHFVTAVIWGPVVPTNSKYQTEHIDAL